MRMTTTQGITGGRSRKKAHDKRKNHWAKVAPRSEIAQRIETLAVEQNLSRVDLARAVDIRYPTLNRMMRVGELPARIIADLAKTLGTSTEFILTGEDSASDLIGASVAKLDEALFALNATAEIISRLQCDDAEDDGGDDAAHLATILAYVEWNGDQEGTTCPCCRRAKPHGHHPQCALGAAVSDDGCGD